MNKRSEFGIMSKKVLFTCILMLAFCLIFINTDAAALMTLDLTKNGNQYNTTLSSSGISSAGTSGINLNSRSAYYEFFVSEWSPWISSFNVGVNYSNADNTGISTDYQWPHVYVKNTDTTYTHYYDLTSRSDTATTAWNSSSISASSKLEAVGSAYKITVKIYAKDAVDNASAKIYTVTLRLNLNYDQFNTLQVDGGPKVVNFGTNIDVGNNINVTDQTVTFKNIGSGTASKSWAFNSPSWITAQSGAVAAGGTGTTTFHVNTTNITSSNINELNGKLVPITGTGLDPNAAGLKGDFYHVPGVDLNNLDTALASTSKKFVYSNIFRTIEFYQAGSTPLAGAFGEDDLFKSGSVTTTLRRDFVAVFTGFIKITTEGSYTFSVTSDDGFRLKVNGTQVAVVTGTRGTATTTSNGVTLSAGIYPIELTYFQGGSSKSLTLQWTPPGGTTEVIPATALYNGLNILVKATPRKPTVTNTTVLGTNSKVNVALNQNATFTVSSAIGSTGVAIAEYKWQQVAGTGGATTSFTGSGTTAAKNYPFNDIGDYMIYCKVVDTKGVESNVISIPVRSWNIPTVNDAPPTTTGVSWYGTKYAGVAGQAINLMAGGTLGANNPAGEVIQRFIWDLNSDWNNIEAIQEPITSPKAYTWSSASPSISVRCRAVNNYGIQSNDKLFMVTVYSPVTANAGGPYNGRPNRAVNLAGSINQASYPGATFQYQWKVYANNAYTNITTSSDGKAQYTWTVEGDYQVQFVATVTTSEGLTLTGSANAAVTVAAGMPTAMPGGPYRGGIAGGDFSPIQVEGNSSNFIEAEDIGHVVDWTWIFDHGTEVDSSNEYRTLLAENIDSIISVLTEVGNGATAERATDNVISGSASLAIRCGATVAATNQRYRTIIPGWSYNIVENPQAANEFRYITFAWRKEGGTGIVIQLHGIANGVASWNYRYHAGTSTWTPSRQTSTTIPTQWEIVTRDLFADYGAFTLNGIAFTAKDGTAAYYDSMYLHKSPVLPVVPKGSPIATQNYSKAGTYTVSLRVKSEFGKWGLVSTTNVEVVDGKITGYVRAADLRTPVKDAQLTLTSSHVDRNVLAAIAAANSSVLHVTNDGNGIYTLTDSRGYYVFEHIPLGSYRIAASKVDNNTAHEFETNIKATELTLNGPNQLAIDFVDLSVFPISGRIVYSIKKNNMDVMVENVTIEAQSVGSTNSIRSLLSTKSGDANGSNYSLPLFSGQYLFLASLQGHDIRLKDGISGYNSDTGLVTIDRARTDIDFVDYTTRTLTVFVKDSGGYDMPNRNVSISGENGQAVGVSDAQDGKLVATLPPGKYTVTVPGAQPETKEADITGGDLAVTMTIPVKIVLSFGSRPRLFDVSDGNLTDFLAQFGITEADNPLGYMYYYSPEPRTHGYTITATANGNAVEDFTVFITDEVSMMTEDPAEEQGLAVQGDRGIYTMTAGLPKQNRAVSPPQASSKRITFRATKNGYLDSDIVVDQVTVLGDVAVGNSQRIVSVPVVNYTVLHDPPGDGSYSYLDDTMSLKGIVSGMTMTIDGGDVPVYPSPWRDERKVSGFNFDKDPNSNTTSSDLGTKGLIGTDRTIMPTIGAFGIASVIEAGVGLGTMLIGPLAFAVQLAKLPILAVSLEAGSAIPGHTGVVQYEVSPNRKIQTPDSSALALVGPGKGDLYYGEGWTLGLQTKYRMGIKVLVDGNGNPILSNGNKQWVLDTKQIETYDILERTNQYVYTINDIVKIVTDLDVAIAQAAEGSAELTKLTNAKTTWQSLLNKNLAYIWNKDYVSYGKSFEEFKSDQGLSDDCENLIFSAGPSFEYSRKVSESIKTTFSYSYSVGTNAAAQFGLDTTTGWEAWGNGVMLKWDLTGSVGINTSTSYGASWEGGKSAEQTVGFSLSDDDPGDNISTRIYADPVWGTPLFFQDPGSFTSDPWEVGTNKTIDVTMSLVSEPSGKFDYHDGAHYKVQIQYAGQKTGSMFKVYAPPIYNPNNLTIIFNGVDLGCEAWLDKTDSSANVSVSLYPPEIDQDNSVDKQYEISILVEEEADYQIARTLTLRPTFADLHAPRAVITAPYSGERVSPAMFSSTKPFNIVAVSEDNDLAKIQLQIRTKQPDGVWEPWRDLSGMIWEDGTANANVTVLDRLNQVPQRHEFTFNWIDTAIRTLGVGEYAIRAVSTDKATSPNTDVDPPYVTFLVDDSKPTVLTSLPDYQSKESQRIYRGELSVIFTDDMRADDFSDRTFTVTDLLNSNQSVAGFVSYSPSLRKAIFVPVEPFKPNGFYRVEIKTDVMKGEVLELGVHDLAGNPLDNGFMWTFHTTDAPFEPTWSIALKVSDSISTDANNIAAVEYSALDGEDERDAMAVPGLASKLRLSFLDRDRVEFDRDIRPADGRISHHWFFAVINAANGSSVTIRWKPSVKLTRTDRQYQVLRLIEFNSDGTVRQTIALDPTLATIDSNTGEPIEINAYTYTSAGEASRHFRLDVMKASLVATALQKGSSGWKFLSVPITPQRSDPFVNLGDDIDPLQLYKYNTALNGYNIYPLDIGLVSLQAGNGYFARLKSDAEVDVAGSPNLQNVTMTLATAGWYPIGNPFILPVNVSSLTFNGLGFNAASALVETTLYRWNVDPNGLDAYEAINGLASLAPWEGYWIKTKQANVTLVIPAPANIANASPTLPSSFNPPLAPSKFQQPIVSAPQFDLRLELVSKSASDLITTLGTRDEAQLGLDLMDQSEPPTLGQTVAAYFDHQDWGNDAGLYNVDYQPTLKVGEERVWTFTVFSDSSNVDMMLSWEKSIDQIPGDVMLYFRRADNNSDWQDMRKVQSVHLVSNSLIAKIPFEVRAQRFEMSPPSDMKVTAGEKCVTLNWKPDSNESIVGYAITRQIGSAKDWKEGESAQYVIQQNVNNPISQFVDREVTEEMTFTYQLSVRFISGAELLSDLFTIRVMPVVKQSALLQNYPNPFNPEVWIPYQLSENTGVTIKIYNASGQLIKTLDLGNKPVGFYTSKDKAAYWDGKNEVGEFVSSGIYFYSIQAGKLIATKKMIIQK